MALLKFLLFNNLDRFYLEKSLLWSYRLESNLSQFVYRNKLPIDVRNLTSRQEKIWRMIICPSLGFHNPPSTLGSPAYGQHVTKSSERSLEKEWFLFFLTCHYQVLSSATSDESVQV